MSRCLAFVVLYIQLIGSDISYSLQDRDGISFDEKILNRMPFSGGVFVEVGAHDGISQSNTKRLEEVLGWTGILVEPSPSLFDVLCHNRPNARCFSCALGAFEEDGTYVDGDFDGSLMSSVRGSRLQHDASIRVPMRSLQSILDEVGVSHVHFFSLDTEGYEFNILQGIDFDRTAFDYILIEIYTKDYNKIVGFLDKKGYRLVEAFSGYTKATHPDWSQNHNDFLFQRRPPLSIFRGNRETYKTKSLPR